MDHINIVFLFLLIPCKYDPESVMHEFVPSIIHPLATRCLL